MEFPTSISPYIRTYVNKDFLLVDIAAPKDTSDKACTSLDRGIVMFYQMYLPQINFDIDTYFDGIKRMLTLDKIMEYGQFVSILIIN